MTPDAHRPTATGVHSGSEDGTPPDVLLAEPDQELARKLVARFSNAGVRTVVCHDGAEALLQAGARQPHVILLGAPLPVVDAVQVTRLIARLHPVPVIVGAGPDGAEEATAALAVGAVAFVARPYRAEEIVPLLLSRLSDDDNPTFLAVGDIELDAVGFHVYVGGRPLQLPVREFLLLRYLMERPNRVITRRELTEALWGTEKLDSNTLTVHVKRVRKKLQEVGGSCCTIDAIRGIGYRLECSSAGPAGSRPASVQPAPTG
ncbi:response regulator transcription factor [Streptomyces sp. NBC_00696]|uniref:response regulator transcription factor n=1 Tax=Streptomyces sp. NBC_00696 TaxID=2903672 RepID=UPI002E310EDA|nr:response regulator transcription factor [Streptomyces sp. NBC_00696]